MRGRRGRVAAGCSSGSPKLYSAEGPSGPATGPATGLTEAPFPDAVLQSGPALPLARLDPPGRSATRVIRRKLELPLSNELTRRAIRNDSGYRFRNLAPTS